METSYHLSRLIRCYESEITCTGGVVFIGDGFTGKTHSAINLAKYKERTFLEMQSNKISKSVNLEFEYFITHSNIEKFKVTISSQLFIMPGQKGKATKGEGLAFEDALDLYFNIRSINEVIVLVLTYNLTDLSTFQNLEYWLSQAIEQELLKEYTSIILLGTHLDLNETCEVDDNIINAGKVFVQQYIRDRIGVFIEDEKIFSVKISNLTKEGISEFQKAISESFFNSFGILEIIRYKLNISIQDSF
ncbi:MAG: hypothetical protein ACTSSF_10750 [Candidatus Heimdallarchaeaceae archaeon]